MEIIRASLQDTQRILPLFLKYREFYKRPAEGEKASSFLEERLQKSQSVIFLALNKQKQPMGFAQLYPSFSSLALQPLWILNDLFVASEFRRQKVAKGLLRACKNLARETGARGLTLQTAVDNLAAQKLYESMNWKRVDQFYSYTLSIEELHRP